MAAPDSVDMVVRTDSARDEASEVASQDGVNQVTTATVRSTHSPTAAMTERRNDLDKPADVGPTQKARFRRRCRRVNSSQCRSVSQRTVATDPIARSTLFLDRSDHAGLAVAITNSSAVRSVARARSAAHRFLSLVAVGTSWSDFFASPIRIRSSTMAQMSTSMSSLPGDAHLLRAQLSTA